jgi:2-iminoacetate synthase
MSVYQIISQYPELDFGRVTHGQIQRAIHSDAVSEEQFLALLSPLAQDHLEEMAQRAHELSLKNFGRVIQLYTPLYLSNYCENQCAYCGFNAGNKMLRKRLTAQEVEKEAQTISGSGLNHILVLTGESRLMSPLSYIQECVGILKKYFSSISAEIYALTEEEYAALFDSGVDGLTIYQETYDQQVYAQVHRLGPKKDYFFRLDAPERAARVRMRNVNIGALLGLSDWRKDIFFTGLHAKYLQDNFSDCDIGASIPRLRPHTGEFKVNEKVEERDLAQIITALRIFLPRLSLALSTREPKGLRDDLLPLGITRMSAGSSTKVGGHTSEYIEETGPGQFEISDPRSVEDIRAMLVEKGYQPVFKDWMRI